MKQKDIKSSLRQRERVREIMEVISSDDKKDFRIALNMAVKSSNPIAGVWDAIRQQEKRIDDFNTYCSEVLDWY